MTEQVEKIYWTIGEVAEHLNMSVSAVRFWCETYPVPHHRNRKGDRKFTKVSIMRLKLIYVLFYVEGLNGKAVLNYLNNN